MDMNLDLFSEFLAVMALEKATGLTLLTPRFLSAEEKRRIYHEAMDTILEAIFAPDDLFELRFNSED